MARNENEAASLRRRGFDGLYHPVEPCDCVCDDLYPCGERPPECRPGVTVDLSDEYGPGATGIGPRARPSRRKGEAA